MTDIENLKRENVALREVARRGLDPICTPLIVERMNEGADSADAAITELREDPRTSQLFPAIPPKLEKPLSEMTTAERMDLIDSLSPEEYRQLVYEQAPD